MSNHRQDIIKWLSEHTSREDWFNGTQLLAGSAALAGAWATVMTDEGQPSVVRYFGFEGPHDDIAFEEVFCEIDQPTFIADATYELTDKNHVPCGHYRYNLNTNKFEHLMDRECTIGASKVGPKKEFTPFLVTKEGFTVEIVGDKHVVGEELMKEGWMGAWGDKPDSIGVFKNVKVTDTGVEAEGELHDPVHKVKHYEVFRGIEAKDIMKALSDSGICDHLTPYESHCFFTMLKYRLRAMSKNDPELSDEEKAIQDLNKSNRYRNCLEK